MAFMTHDEYINTFGKALSAAGTPGIAPGGGQPPQIGTPEGWRPPMAPPPEPGAFQVSPPAPPAPAGWHPPQSLQQGPSAPPMGDRAFGGAPPPQQGPAPAAPPAGPAFAPEEPSKDNGQMAGGGGKTVRDYLAEAPEEEKKELIEQVEEGFGTKDIEGLATQTAAKDPELAAQYKTGPADKEWDKAEAAAFLMEFGLRMLQASGSGTGNFASDVGGSALGAMDARRAAKDKERARAFEEEDRDWTRKVRGREEGQWDVKDREAARERKRKSEIHEKNMRVKDWKREVGKDGNVVFIDPNTGARFETDLPNSGRDADGRISAFREKMNIWQDTAAGLNGVEWEELDPAQQAAVNKAFFEYEKTGVGTAVAKQNFIQEMIDAGHDMLPSRITGNPEALSEAKARIEREAVEQANRLFPEEQGGMPVFGERPPPNATPDELIEFYRNSGK